MQPTPTVEAPRRIRRLWFVLLCLLPAIVLRGLTALAERYDFGEGAQFQLMQFTMFGYMLAILGIGFWFFFLSGLWLKLRIAVALLLVGGIVGLIAITRTVEFDGQMQPKFVWNWDADPNAVLAAHRASAGKAASTNDVTVGPTDSPAFRNAGDGLTPNVVLTDWDKTPPTILWKQPAGGGHAGFAIAGNSAITVEQIGDDEVVASYDRATGKDRWRYAYPAKFDHTQPMGGAGPRTTPAVANGFVYSLGGRGDLVCLDGATGAKKWATNIVTDASADVPEWGISGSPLIVGQLVVVNPGARGLDTGSHGIIAYNRETGAKVWNAAGRRAAYASPTLITLAGTPQILTFDSAGLTSFYPETGERLWSHPWKSPMEMNSAQPVAVGDNRVLLSSEKDNGTAVLEVTKSEGGKWSVAPVWRTRKFAARYTTPVFFNGHIFGLGDGRLHCLDAATGTTVWSDGDFGNGQILRAGDRLVLTNEKGSVHLVAADAAEFRELGKLPVFGDRTWNMPALAGNQLFVRNHREMACVQLP